MKRSQRLFSHKLRVLKFRVEPLGVVEYRRRVTIAVLVTAFAIAALLAPLVYAGAPLEKLVTGYVSTLLSPRRWVEVSKYAAALMLTGLAGVVAFRSRVWNIGLEGYLVIGAVATAAAAYSTGSLLLEALFSAAAGAAWGALVSILYVLGVSEIVVSMMLYYVARYLLLYAVYRLWPSEYGLFPQTPEWSPRQPLIVGLPSMLLVSTALCIFSWLLYARTLPGLVARLAGVNEKAAAVAGYSARGVKVAALLASSALAGLAGFHVASMRGYLSKDFVELGYGSAGITVAFLASLNPLLVVPAAFFMALLYHFGIYASSYVPGGVATYFYYVQGVLLLAVVLAKTLPRYRIVIVRG